MPVPVLSPDLVELVGGIAAVLTTLSFLPQVLKAWRSRSARDVSLLMLLLFLAGVLLWLCYGLALGSLPLILANAVTAVLILAILAAKLRFRTPGPV
ncbi:SemiSWEET family sugar transporter [Oceanibaculum indicum]|uniref:MtN3 and saliva related transmembrane protein n=1 Tax=Oceanibaculum indicum TaxID=526216 RepID=A0A420WRL8_9PROT|nr:SemiSWEET transporter [Oceanibaculum indicum]RKQ73545.1 MtN3 and saliva related transmembrane protein [Oceanibaculum indicum]